VWANYNNFTKNICNSNNQIGILVSGADRNSFKFNNISYNPNGIRLESNNNYNTFTENDISYNTNVGFSIESGSFNNDIYHNFFISNSQQAYDNSSNNWDYIHQGNYWDDYTGLDNGANGRVAGDRIGDTDIPHPGPGLDNYPFLNPYDWLYPDKPGLIIESVYDPDGNYTVSWLNSSRVTGYIFQEDENIAFSSPTTFTDGWVTENDFNILSFTGKAEGTCYYRAKALSDLGETGWSEIVNVTVDFPPMIPQNLNATAVPEGNELEIAWDANPADTVQYGLHYRNGSTWELLENITHPIHSYKHSDLIDDIKYYYKICAIDPIGQSSAFSERISGRPQDSVPPLPPTGLKAVAISNSEIQLKWDANTDLDFEGYDIFINTTTNLTGYDYEVIHKIMGNDTSYLVSNLTEEVTYQFRLKAFDEVPNDSLFSEIASATTPDETPPPAPTNLTVFNATVNSLTITWKIDPLSDVVGYLLNRSYSESGPYDLINPEPITDTQYTDTGLDENTTYYYKIRAIDEVNLESFYSESANGTTLLGPKKPVINNPLIDFEISEDSYDDSSINLLNCFTDINNDKLTFRCEGQNHINVTIFQENGSVLLEPEADWSGSQILTFYADDGTFEIYDTVTVTVTPLNDPPLKPTIVTPNDGTIIKEGELLDFLGICSDLDLPYGDVLTFKWSSTIDGNLGMGANKTGVLLSAGNHTIILIVTDSSGAKSMASIDIVVTAKSAAPKSEGESFFTSINMLAIIVIVIIVVLIIIFFLFFKKKKPTYQALAEEQVEPVTPVEGVTPGKPEQPTKQPTPQVPPTPAKAPEPAVETQRQLCSSCGLEMVYDKDIESYSCGYCDVWEEE
jgi:fibronectin type 3 domain-containing protein